MKRLIAIALLVACTSSPTTPVHQGLTTEVKHQRYALIRDTAAGMGQTNAALLAGIAISETNLAHCWSEATYACQGPASPSCDNGPVIAGAADGPCAAMQGGLGIFQFDAGTYADTLKTYGSQILTLEGNTAQAVSFVVDKVTQDVSEADDWLGAMAWMNAIKLDSADPVMNQWAALLACRYNGCCSTSSTCKTRADGYRDNAIAAYTEMGAPFWQTSGRCMSLPADGVIDERTGCYVAGGDPRHWRTEPSGHGGGLEWTLTTDSSAPTNFAVWIIRAGAPGRYHIEVYLDGGKHGRAKTAHYQIAHAGTVDTVTIDQTSGNGFVALGDFELAGTGDEHVLLGDNTGESPASNTKLLFDAIRVRSLDHPAPAPSSGAGCGGCATGGGAGGVAFAWLVWVGRRQTVRRP